MLTHVSSWLHVKMASRIVSGRPFQMTGAAMWKLSLPSSVAVLSTARSRPRPAERRPARTLRFAVAMQTCVLEVKWSKVYEYSSSQSNLPHRFGNSHAIWDHTQYYLPPDRGDTPAFTPAEAGTRLSDPAGMQGWVHLVGLLHTEMVYPPEDGHPSKY